MNWAIFCHASKPPSAVRLTSFSSTKPPGLAYRVFRDGRIVFERDHRAFVDRKVRAILEYLDFQPMEEPFTRAVLEAARRG